MATVPLSGTNVRLLSGIPYSNDYKHSRWHTSLDAQIAYFNSGAVDVVYAISTVNFQRQNNQTFMRIDKSIDEIFNVNYLRFQNAGYDTKWFYAFVTKLEYVQRNTTYVHFEIDVIQTYMFDMKFKPSFVVREHRPLWNNDGSPVINTVDEGLNYGSEYDTVSCLSYKPLNDIYYLVIVSMRTIHETPKKITPGFIGVPQPLTYYLHPFKLNNDTVKLALAGAASTVEGNTLFDLPHISDILQACFIDETAVGEIVSMYITEHCGLEPVWISDLNALSLESALMDKVDISGVSTVNVWRTFNSPDFGFSPYTEIDCLDKYLAYKTETSSFYEESTKNNDDRSGLESKLLMYPYSYTSLEDNRGNHVILKNEYINDPKLKIKVFGSMGLSNKVAYIPYQYSNDVLFTEAITSYEYALVNDSPMDVSIINDFLSAYLQGHRNSMKNQVQAIAFDGTMSVASAAIGGIANSMAMSATGNPLGTVAGAASAGLGMVKGAGNAVLQLQGMMAQIKDARNTPPTLQKMGSNTAFDFGNHFSGFVVKKKQIKPEYQRKLSDFFKTYGYKTNEVKIPNFYTRKRWNYIQTNACNITGNFNAEDLNEIKGVFDGGITLWHTDDIGNYTLLNPEFTVIPPAPPAPVLFTGQSFGRNDKGQLGLGFQTTTEPQVVASVTDSLTALTAGFMDVSFGYGIMVAVDAIGRLWYCGDSPLGLSGVQPTPTLSTITDVKKVACDIQGNGNLFLKEDGTVRYIGYGSSGERAGEVGDSNVSTQIPNLTDIVAIKMGSSNCFAINSNGDLYAWGDNTFGGIGNGSTSGANVIVPTLILSGVKEFEVGNDHMLALKTNGDLYAWGLNRYGACGLPYNAADYNIYTPTLTATNVTKIACGNMHSLYIANDGKVYSTGNPAQGGLATGVSTIPTAERDDPTQDRYYHWKENQFPTDLDGIACGEYNSFGWRGNTVYACGRIQSGNCLGDGRAFDFQNGILQIPLINYNVAKTIDKIVGTAANGSVMILSKK